MSKQGFAFGLADGGAEFFNGTATAGQTTIPVQTTQVAAAARLTAAVNVAVPITGSTALLLPKNHPVGSPIVVQNEAATAVSLLVFPPWDDVAGAATGGAINGGTANASVTIAQGKAATFWALPSGIDFVCQAGA